MKTEYTQNDVRQFLETTEKANPRSIKQLKEGHNSQALSFETIEGEKLILRISAKEDDFLADKYAFEHFGEELLVPRVVEIGHFGKDSYYCITELAEGKISNALTQEEMPDALPSIHDAFAKIFEMDVSGTAGYGHIDLKTSNAVHTTWKVALTADLEDLGVEALKENARNIDLDPVLIDKFVVQFNDNLPYASEIRRLVHGDLGFDNLLLNNNEVTAVIDWARMEYGDWMLDFAKLDFWWPDRFGDSKEFAEKYGLDGDNIHERIALYWALTALDTIRFADKSKNEKIAGWLHEHVSKKLV